MPPEIKPEPTSADIFSQAFEQIAALDATGPTGPVTPSVTVEGPTGLPESVVRTPEEIAIAEGVTAPTGPTGPTGTPEPTEEEKAAKAAADAAAADAANREAFAQTIAEGLKRGLPQPQPQDTRVVQPEPASSFTPEDTEFLTNYIKEFPDIARAEALLRQNDLRTAVGYVFSEVTKALQPHVEKLQVMAERLQLGDIQQLVPDYAMTREKVIEWAMKQPAYLQPSYKYVIERGTADEVADLIQRYRAATGATAPALTPTVDVVSPKKEDDLPAAAKKAVAALAPVASKRSVAVAVEPTDFDSAFTAFANRETGSDRFTRPA